MVSLICIYTLLLARGGGTARGRRSRLKWPTKGSEGERGGLELNLSSEPQLAHVLPQPTPEGSIWRAYMRSFETRGRPGARRTREGGRKGRRSELELKLKLTLFRRFWSSN